MLTMNDTHIISVETGPYTIVFNSRTSVRTQFSSVFRVWKVCLHTIHLSNLILLFTTATTTTCLHISKIRHKTAHIIHRHIPYPIFKWLDFLAFFFVYAICVCCWLSTFAVPGVVFFRPFKFSSLFWHFSFMRLFIALGYRTTVSEEDIRDAFTKNNFEIKAFKFFP